MAYLAPGSNRRTAGLIFVLLVCGITPVMFAQNRPVQKVMRVQIDGSPYLGIQMEDVTADNMARFKLTVEHGVIVKSVEKGSPAESAKLMENDVILEYAGMPVFSARQFARLVQETPVGRKVEIGVSRDGNKIALTPEIGKRDGPHSFDNGLNMMPPWGNGRGFEFFGPDGRSFQFQIPEGRGFMYGMPDTDNGPFPSGKTRLGVMIEPLSDQMAEFLGVPGKKGLLVTSVESGSPAASKLKAGDVITRADNQAVGNPDDLAGILQSKDDGTIDLKVIRNKKEVSVTVELPKREQGQEKRGYRL